MATSRSIAAADEDDFLTIRGEIAEPATAQSVVEQALDRFARIDCLVNDAGVFIGKPFTDYTLEEYALDHLGEPGRLLPPDPMRHCSNGHAEHRPRRQRDHQPGGPRRQRDVPPRSTALTKGGLAAATRSLAIEYASRGVRVNAVALGVIRTSDDLTSYAGMDELHPLARLGEISDVVDGVLYLERATFVTGEILHIDGGQAAGH